MTDMEKTSADHSLPQSEVMYKGHTEHIDASVDQEGMLVRPARVFTEAEEKALYRKVSPDSF
jgi:hypothetical protein